MIGRERDGTSRSEVEVDLLAVDSSIVNMLAGKKAKAIAASEAKSEPPVADEDNCHDLPRVAAK